MLNYKEMSSSKILRFYYTFLAIYFVFQILFLITLKLLNKDTHSNAFAILQIYKKLSVELNNNKQLDNSGLYKIIRTKQLKKGLSFDITVISQCSSNHFASIETLFESWKGPISVAVFSEIENVERTLWDMSKFLHCNRWREFGMHLVVPAQDTYIKDYKFPSTLLSAADKSVPCDSYYLSVINGKKNYNWTSAYPINLLRNVAKLETSTDYVLVIDIDMIPSFNLRYDFLNFAKLQHSNPGKVVYVVPTFEILPDVPIPQDKTELLSAFRSNQARPFYIVPCENCQKLTKYDEWLESDTPIGTKILYTVEWKHPWEPFFIAKNSVPNFDERFKQYGMNRVSQICELHVAGFKFAVLDNIFLLHKGFKESEGFHETKEKEMDGNRRLYIRFKSEIVYKYPASQNSC